MSSHQKNFFEKTIEYLNEMRINYISRSKYYPPTRDKAKGWSMVIDHAAKNEEYLLKVFEIISRYFLSELRMTNPSYDSNDVINRAINVINNIK